MGCALHFNNNNRPPMSSQGLCVTWLSVVTVWLTSRLMHLAEMSEPQLFGSCLFIFL